jgi:hypothetical protein
VGDRAGFFGRGFRGNLDRLAEVVNGRLLVALVGNRGDVPEPIGAA